MNWLQHTYASKLPKHLFSEQLPVPVGNPSLILFNNALADELGITEHTEDEQKMLSYLSGNEAVSGSKPIAQAYAGHQFGHFTKLGDGRAVLLGEMDTKYGLMDLQLKGSGQTPYSRRGDGRATLYSMLREYLISEAMHALGVPTTRSLAVVKTTDKVYREEVNEGGILSRVAASHIRVGTFEYARYFGKKGDLEALLQFTIQRHYPELLAQENHALALLEVVARKQKDLMIDWLRVGFIHGVMNTDNMAISGQTIDYGPCAFMNAYHPSTVFSSIDTEGRYAYASQPDMAFWNLRVFANALLPTIDVDEEVAKSKAQEVLRQFPADFSKGYLQMMTAKLGIVNHVSDDQALVKECLSLLVKHQVDYTNFFTELRREGALLEELKEDDAFLSWFSRWEKARYRTASLAESESLMIKNNPVVIPRNHLVEDVLIAAVLGNMHPFHELLDQLSSPYADAAGQQLVPANFDASYQTFCGT